MVRRGWWRWCGLAITEILDAGRAAGDLRPDVTADDIAASVVAIFTVAEPPDHQDRAGRLLDGPEDPTRRR